jgi:large-conductance mechanosensitive channel
MKPETLTLILAVCAIIGGIIGQLIMAITANLITPVAQKALSGTSTFSRRILYKWARQYYIRRMLEVEHPAAAPVSVAQKYAHVILAAIVVATMSIIEVIRSNDHNHSEVSSIAAGIAGLMFSMTREHADKLHLDLLYPESRLKLYKSYVEGLEAWLANHPPKQRLSQPS